MTTERVPRIDVFTNPHAGLPLPEAVFVGPYDRTYAMIDDEYTLVAEGIALDGYYF